MKHFRRPLFVVGLTVATAFLSALGAAAQVTGRSGGPLPAAADSSADRAAQQLQAQAPIPSEFGVASDSILQVHASAFTPRHPTATLDYTTATEVTGNITGFAYWAPVNLPEGAIIDYLDLYGCDTNATSHMTVYLSGYGGSGGSSNPGLSDFFFVQSTQISTPASGCGYWVKGAPASFKINNNAEYASGYQYALNLAFGVANSTNRFRAVDIWWRRQVSPAPATASFTDVPTSYWAFQWIEALKASGITGGVTPTTYEPESPVTRAQMAVFLAKALGLHWPL